MAKKESREAVRVEPAKALSPFEEMERRFEELFRRPSFLSPAWLPGSRMKGFEELSPKVFIE
jgi:hypothetical protein